ncbi:MAG: LexA family protein [Janthinobacterium lividum]
MNIGQKIKYLRESNGITLQEIGDLWGISRSSVAGWEAGAAKPGIDKLPALARKLGTTVDELLNDRLISGTFKPEPHNAVAVPTRGMLPVISYVQAGQWSEIANNFDPGEAEEWLPCPFNHGPNSFVLRVAGLSMYNPSGDKSYSPGEYIVVDPNVEPSNKKMVVVRLDHEDKATFKQIIIGHDGTIMLQALNPSYSPRLMEMPPESVIAGVVIGKFVPE